MNKYKVTNPATGQTLILKGDKPPTQSDVAEAFEVYSKNQTANSSGTLPPLVGPAPDTRSITQQGSDVLRTFALGAVPLIAGGAFEVGRAGVGALQGEGAYQPGGVYAQDPTTGKRLENPFMTMDQLNTYSNADTAIGQVVRDEVGLASWAVPFGKAVPAVQGVANPLIRGGVNATTKYAIPGAVSSTLAGVSQGQTPEELKQTATTGAALSLAVPALSNLTKYAVNKVRNPAAAFLENEAGRTALKGLKLTPSQQQKFKDVTGEEPARFLLKRDLNGADVPKLESYVDDLQSKFDTVARDKNIQVKATDIALGFDDLIYDLETSGIESNMALARSMQNNKNLFMRKYFPTADQAEIGITSFRGKPVGTIAETTYYYGTTRSKGLENSLKATAKKHGIQVDDIKKTAGVWWTDDALKQLKKADKGQTPLAPVEPSLNVSMRFKNPEELYSYAAENGMKYGRGPQMNGAQDAVALWIPGAGTDTKYIFSNIGEPDNFIKGMRRRGLQGGYVLDDAVVILDKGNSLKDDIIKLGGDFNATIKKEKGFADFIPKESYEAYARMEKSGDVFWKNFNKKVISADDLTQQRIQIDKAVKKAGFASETKSANRLYRDVLQDALRARADELGIKVNGMTFKQLGFELKKIRMLTEMAERQSRNAQSTNPIGLTALLGMIAGGTIGRVPGMVAGAVGTHFINKPSTSRSASNVLMNAATSLRNAPPSQGFSQRAINTAGQIASHIAPQFSNTRSKPKKTQSVNPQFDALRRSLERTNQFNQTAF